VEGEEAVGIGQSTTVSEPTGGLKYSHETEKRDRKREGRKRGTGSPPAPAKGERSRSREQEEQSGVGCSHRGRESPKKHGKCQEERTWIQEYTRSVVKSGIFQRGRWAEGDAVQIRNDKQWTVALSTRQSEGA